MIHIDPAEVRAEIIQSAGEDYYGLWELIWALNTAHPEIDEATKVAAAASAIVPLLQEGAIRLYRGEWRDNAFAPLELSEAIRLVTDTTAWDPPPNGSRAKFVVFGLP
jgi:hypothetical protein